MNEAEATAKVIESFESKYAEIIVSELKQVNAISKTLNYDNLIENIHKVSRLYHTSKSNDENNHDDIMLVNVNFKGKRYSCGNTWHKKKNCHEKKSGSSNNESNKKTKKQIGKCREYGQMLDQARKSKQGTGRVPGETEGKGNQCCNN